MGRLVRLGDKPWDRVDRAALPTPALLRPPSAALGRLCDWVFLDTSEGPVNNAGEAGTAREACRAVDLLLPGVSQSSQAGHVDGLGRTIS